MKFSANLGFLFTELPLPEAIRAAHKAGFDAVECHFPYDTPARDVARALHETGMAMVSLNTLPGDLMAGDFGLAALTGREDEARAAIDQAIDYAVQINAGAVHVMAGITDGGAAGEASFRANLAYACDLSATHGIGILIEPINTRDVPGYHLSSSDHAARIIHDLKRKNLRLMFDCYHIAIMDEGDVFTRFQALRPLIGHVQFAALPDRSEPDRGEINSPRLLRQMEKAGYNAPFGAEYRPRGETTAEGLGWMDMYRASPQDKPGQRPAAFKEGKPDADS
ncbi:hydroxypyruvate isomerase [Roseovarius marisflavi]|uniref:Hydroxypyruvate isomerase n=1 Tax=Roseovarius marisflavi TaxID=1054996 RepID=A0A1M6VB06_9RHOB|nr:TIM barrel protein [Roseovarius marisflavi]SHK78682.1 hydroxypyruvate isomerase [Roseovarius marisflavi]